MSIKRKIYLALIGIFAVVFVASVAMLGLTMVRYEEADAVYDDLRDRFVSAANPATPPVAEETAPAEPVIPPIQIDFDLLCRENADVVGWLYCEGTVINYPVVQRPGDNTYYLHRGLNGRYLVSGTIFVDGRCGGIAAGWNHIIYGHNMDNGTIFGSLVKYKDQSYYEEHPVLWYLTPEGNWRIDLFAGLVTDVKSDVYTPAVSSDSLTKFRESSTFVSPVPVSASDAVITLSTCSYEFNNARYVVMGKLTPATQ